MKTEVSMTEKDEKNWAMAAHLASLAGFAFPFGNIIGPLVIWLVKKDESEFVDEQGKESLNFQITFILTYFIIIIGFLFITLLVGGFSHNSSIFLGTFLSSIFLIFALYFAIYILQIIFIIMAALKVNEGKHYRYPINIRFFK